MEEIIDVDCQMSLMKLNVPEFVLFLGPVLRGLGGGQ